MEKGHRWLARPLTWPKIRGESPQRPAAMDHGDRDDQLPRHVSKDRVCGREGRVAENPIRKILVHEIRLLGNSLERWSSGSRLGRCVHGIDVAGWQSPGTGGS